MDLHTHTNYSDGEHSLYEMAKEAERLGCTEYIVTDHDYSMTPQLYMKQVYEAEYLVTSGTITIPIICGLQISKLPFCLNGLLFGRSAILKYLSATTTFELSLLRNDYYALILAHPEFPNLPSLLTNSQFISLINACSGIEVEDSLGRYTDRNELLLLDNIKVLKRLKVTDAHTAYRLKKFKSSHLIVTETDLINYLHN